MKILVEGIGITKFGELWDKSLIELATEAAQKALLNSGVDPKEIEAVFVGNMLSGILENQEHLSPAIIQLLKIPNPAAVRVEGACASGGLAVHMAVNALEANQYKKVLVIGAEKMTDASTAEISKALMAAASESERQSGLTFPGLYALIASTHMKKFGTTKKHLAEVAVKNHYHGSLNPYAQFQKRIIIEQVLNSTMIADPLSLYDASPITDGAAAVVLSRDKKPDGIYITASSAASDSLDLSERVNLFQLKATQIASQKAFEQAGVSIKDVNVAEVHDCFTIAEILAMEDIGFCKKGEGGEFISSGKTKLGNGKLVVNTSGGLKAAGHPVGATGVKQIVEIFMQLKGTAGERQVRDAKIGLTQNVGGTGATVVIHILQR